MPLIYLHKQDPVTNLQNTYFLGFLPFIGGKFSHSTSLSVESNKFIIVSDFSLEAVPLLFGFIAR